MPDTVHVEPGDQLRMPTTFPTAKLIAAQLAVFVTPLLWYWISKYTPVPLPENAQTFLDALVQSAITGAIGLGAGWLKSPAARDVPVVVRKRRRRRQPVTRPASDLSPPAPTVRDPLAAAVAELDEADRLLRREAPATPPDTGALRGRRPSPDN